MCIDDDWEHDDWEDDDEGFEDELDNALQECGLLPLRLGGGCQLSGTEYCDFDCPFRDHPEWVYGDVPDDEESI